jgi:hypothetical protein
VNGSIVGGSLAGTRQHTILRASGELCL